MGVQSSPGVVDELVATLESAILRGEYPAGTRIREAPLATALGVGRGSMREAVRRLEGRKVLVRRPNLGTTIAVQTVDQIRELIELREGLEVTSCRLAAEKITRAQLANMKRLLHQQTRMTGNPADYPGDWRTLDFHYQIAVASNNERLRSMLCEDILFLLRLYRHAISPNHKRLPHDVEDHYAILEALAARDPDACEKAMRTHLRRWRQVVLPNRLGSRS